MTAAVCALLLLGGLLTLSPIRSAAAPAAVPFRSSVWLPYWRLPAAADETRANADVLRTASLFWYDARSCGTVRGYPGAGDRTTVSRLRARGVHVVATVTATGLSPTAALRCFADAGRRATHVARLVSIVRSRSYAGLDLDYEELAVTTDPRLAVRVRAAYSQLVTDLCAKLRKIDRQCIVTVMPRTTDATAVWRGRLIPGVYDYRALGAAVHRLRVMAYDQHAGRYGPGPIAGYGWVRDVVRYTSATVALRKVELGIPTYGRDFARGRSVSLVGDEAAALARRHHVRLRFDDAQREATFRYREHGVTHTVWFSSPRAVATRTRLARVAGMAGAAYWAVGLAAPGTWAAVRRVR